MRLTSVPSGAIPCMEDRAWALTTSTAAFSARSHCRVALHRWKPARERRLLELRHLCGFAKSPFPVPPKCRKRSQPFNKSEARLVTQQAGRNTDCQEVKDPELRSSYEPHDTQPNIHWEQDRGTDDQTLMPQMWPQTIRMTLYTEGAKARPSAVTVL